ncbi:MAG: hypothetical protein JXB10_10425 [Pirellulales bacterium]|nr:hypothetical protein [Pirellulales bacterium]
MMLQFSSTKMLAVGWGAIFLAGLLLFIGGCGPSRPTMCAVTGTVRYQGKPVGGASVTFLNSANRPGYGITDEQGRFQLGTWEEKDGGVVGKCTVTITKWVSVKEEHPPGAKEIRKLPSTIHPGETVILANFLPLQYGNPRKTPLSVVISTEKENDFTFDLKD